MLGQKLEWLECWKIQRRKGQKAVGCWRGWNAKRLNWGEGGGAGECLLAWREKLGREEVLIIRLEVKSHLIGFPWISVFFALLDGPVTISCNQLISLTEQLQICFRSHFLWFVLYFLYPAALGECWLDHFSDKFLEKKELPNETRLEEEIFLFLRKSLKSWWMTSWCGESDSIQTPKTPVFIQHKHTEHPRNRNSVRDNFSFKHPARSVGDRNTCTAL